MESDNTTTIVPIGGDPAHYPRQPPTVPPDHVFQQQHQAEQRAMPPPAVPRERPARQPRGPNNPRPTRRPKGAGKGQPFYRHRQFEGQQVPFGVNNPPTDLPRFDSYGNPVDYIPLESIHWERYEPHDLIGWHAATQRYYRLNDYTYAWVSTLRGPPWWFIEEWGR